jgi:hypothetical protein
MSVVRPSVSLTYTQTSNHRQLRKHRPLIGMAHLLVLVE